MNEITTALYDQGGAADVFALTITKTRVREAASRWRSIVELTKVVTHGACRRDLCRSASLTFGAVVVAFHNVWTGLPVILTLVGWAQVIKALVAFVMPTWSMRSLERVSVDRAHEFVVAGALFLVLSGLMGYIVMTT